MRTSDLGAEENIQGMEALITGLSVNKHECISEDVRDILSVLLQHPLCSFQKLGDKGWMGHYLAIVYSVKRA